MTRSHRLNEFCCVWTVALFIMIGSPVAALAQVPDSSSMRRDTTTARRDTVAADTVPNRPFGAPLGSVIGAYDDPGSFITKRDLVSLFYMTAFDILRDELPAYPLTLGTPGSVRALSIDGTGPDALGVSYNGRPLHNIGRDGFDLELYPVEFLERMEVLDGVRSVMYGNGSATNTINFVQPHFDVYGSYLRLWYTQMVNNTAGVGALYSRNISNTVNLAFGVRHITSDGIDNANQSVSNWSVHSAVTWNPSNRFSLSLTELFADQSRGISGGLSDSSTFDPVVQDNLNDSLAEETTRHDLTLSARWYPFAKRSPDTGSVFRTLPDTSIRLDASLFYTHAYEGYILSQTSDSSFGSSEGRYGADLRLFWDLRAVLLEGKLGFDLTNSRSASVTTFAAMASLPVSTVAILRGSMNISRNATRVLGTTIGIEGIARLDNFYAKGGFINRVTDAVCDPTIGIDSTYEFPEPDTFTKTYAEVGWRSDEAFIRLRGAMITSGNTCVSTDMKQADAKARIPLFAGISIGGHMLAQIPSDSTQRFPQWYANADITAHLHLFNNNLDLRIGSSIEYQSAFRGVQYDSYTHTFSYPIYDTTRPLLVQTPQWNIFATARVGSAFLRIGLSNILNTEFYTVYRYPVLGRSFNFGVTWVMID